MKNILITVFALFSPGSAVVSTQDNREIKKIDFLISSVENLKGTKFIRNRSEYDGKEAAEHLRMKLNTVGKKVKTT